LRPALANIAKWTGAVTQTIECLLSKLEALSSNSRPTNKKKRKETNKQKEMPVTSNNYLYLNSYPGL
jgi:hypothetical protein